jgi:hypothetical protein
MSIEQIVDVPASGQLIIQIPFSLKDRRRVKLTINEIDDELENKVSLLQKAAQDKDFLFDLEEVNKDFDYLDSKIEE